MKNTKTIGLLITAISFLSMNLFAQTEIEATVPGEQLTERYPEKIIDRPSVMPTGIIQFETRPKMTGLERINVDLTTKFGIINGLQGELGYGGLNFDIGKDKVFSASQTLKVGAKYNYLSVPHVSLSVQGSMPFHIWTGEHIVRDYTVGLPVVFYNELMAGGILHDLFHHTMRPDFIAEFNFPFWYGVQVYGNFWANLNGSFGTVTLKDGQWTAVGFWKKLNLELEAVYAFNNYFDLGAFFGFDNALKPKETMSFGLSFAARAGRLFG